MELYNSEIITGYSKQCDNIWTVEFTLNKIPENYNIHFNVTKFKIIQIEDINGKLLRKASNYSINCEYYLRKHPIHVFLKRENLDFYKFYEKNKDKYNTYTGQVTEYHPNGNLFISYYLISGKLNGNFIAKTDNGDIIEESIFVDNMRHGFTKVKCHGYEFHCDFNMGELINSNIILTERQIYNIYENYMWNNNNGIAIENGTINIIDNIYEYDSYSNKNIISHIGFTGTMVLENRKIISSNIIVTDIHKQKLINEYVTSVPVVILKPYYF